uniref:CID domain-containing protein n=1 Tax=Mesocestoides corti TaxID=53468 RepID=A0A5K3EJJ4_MESCO
MLAEAQEVLKQFRQALSGLRENDKNKINKLTFLARDNAHLTGVPQGIVEATSCHVYEIPASYKLLGLYVIDSIVKNVDVPYRQLFTNNIVPLFVHSFQMIRDEATRKRLFNLRTTWKEIFPSSMMRSLDMQVREHDPAWPIIPIDEAHPPNRIPSVPKIPQSKLVEKPIPIATSQLTTPVTEAVIAEGRDPRRNRKRKSSPDNSESQFLIDRDGNRKMESIARKHGKEEMAKIPKKSRTLFSVRDQDMRSVQSSKPRSPDVKQSFVKQQDVDMRIGGAPPASTAVLGGGSVISASTTPMIPSTNLVSARLPRVASSECLSHGASPNHSRPPVQQHQSLPQPTQGLPLPHYHRAGRPLGPHRPSPERTLPPPPPSVYSRPRNVPPIRGPMWSVEIDGLPEMINIGIDPRMLSRVQNPKMARQITVDGRQYPLLLDRVQPLIKVEDQLHAVRFRCDSLVFLIDHQRYVIPGTGYTRIRAAGRERIAYLGGPGHEIVIDGRPHTIPFNSHYATINIDRQTVSVMYACEFPQDVNVLPAIPPKILDWAYRGLFGSPGSLHLAPLNPLVELERQSENRQDSVKSEQQGPTHFHGRQLQSSQKHGHLDDKSSKKPDASREVPAPSAPPVNVQDLLQKLIAAGIVNKPESLPSLAEYNWEKFRQPFSQEIDALYSGFQCAQCGVRFESEKSSDFDAHLDYHYVKNSAEHREHRNRTYYQASHYWLLSETTNEGVPQFSVPVNTVEKEEVKCPSFSDESLNVCAVCFEKFDKVFDRDEGEWMLRGAVIENGKAYHPICLEDVGKQFPVGMVTAEKANSLPQVPSSVSGGENECTSPKIKAEQNSSVSPVPSSSQLSVPLKSEPQIIETKNGLDDLNFSCSRDSPQRSSPPPRVASLPCGLSSMITGSVKPKEESATLPLPPSSLPTNPTPLPVKREYNDDSEGKLGATSPPIVNIPGLSPASSGNGNDQDERTIGGLDSGNEGGNVATAASISSNPVEALQAFLRGETSIL